MGMKGKSSRIRKMSEWIERQSTRVKLMMLAMFLTCLAFAVKFMLKRNIYIYYLTEILEFIGILVLIYKLIVHKTCSGLSLKSQELTAIYLAAKFCSGMSVNHYLFGAFNLATLLPTAWVIYMMRTKLKSTYNAKLDNILLYKVVVPCAILAILIHPKFSQSILFQFLWGFGAYLEAISVLPQLRLIQKAKVVEPYIAHYVFALGIARFVGFVFWVLRIYETDGRAYFLVLKKGFQSIWVPALLLAETVQTFILADFCYYYVKSMINGQVALTIPI